MIDREQTRKVLKKILKSKSALLGLVLVGFFVILALGAPVLSPHNPANIDPSAVKLPFAWKAEGMRAYPLGTDDVGRDLLSRLIYGSQISLGMGLLVVVFSLTLGAFIGLIAGYFGGYFDKLVMRSMDMIMALPSILLAILVVAILGPGLINTVIAVSIVAIPSFVRLIRAAVLCEKQKDYVQAARSLGASNARILFINIFPNCLAPLIVQGTLGFSDGILNAAALGFLGLGAQPPLAEWGTMLADSRSFIESSPGLVALPGLCIFLVVLGFNLLGDGLRDALDPRMKT